MFGNAIRKIEGYRAFWKRTNPRPLIGFSQIGWFPFQYFSACRNWKVNDYVTPEMIVPAEWLDDQERLLTEGDEIDDDILRGACPTQVAFPVFLPAMLGSAIRVVPDTVIAEERKLAWSQALQVRFDADHAWLKKYLTFTEALVDRSRGRYPVSHSAELGPTDLLALLRGHNESLIDLVDEPDKTIELLQKLGSICIEFTQAAWERIPLYCGGYYDAQYQLWAPDEIIRMQEDATAVFSPSLYRRLVQPVDRFMAGRFPCAFMHLHSTSMFLLEAFLEIDELRCFEINIESFNIPVADMIEFFRMVQAADRCLLIRGSLLPDEMRMLLGSLDPRGLYLHVVVKDIDEAERLSAIVNR